MDYILKGGLSDQLKMSQVFGEVCAGEGVDLSVMQQITILKKFIERALTAGVIKEVPTEGNGKE